MSTRASRGSASARVLLAVASLLVTATCGELSFRLVHSLLGIESKRIGAMRDVVLRGESVFYSPRAFTNFGLRPGVGNVNERGFLGWPSDYPRARTSGVPRVACLGASTTQGGNPSGILGSYPYRLKLRLVEELGGPVEVMNFGVSGWTTAETLVGYLLTVQDYSPDIVVVHHAINDVAPRLYQDYRNDYMHYRTAWSPPPFSLWQQAIVTYSDLATWLLLHTRGVPHQRQFNTRDQGGPLRLAADGSLDPATGEGIRRNLTTLADLVELSGSQVVFMTMPLSPVPEHTSAVQRAGAADHNQLLRELASSDGRLLVDAAERFDTEADRLRDVFSDAVHVSPEGNQRKADLVADALLEAGWLRRHGP